MKKSMKKSIIVLLFLSIILSAKAQSYFGNEACWTEFWVNPNTPLKQIIILPWIYQIIVVGYIL